MAEKGGGGIEGGGGGERWKAALVNLSEMGTNVESLQKILVKKAVFVDEETSAKSSLTSEQARTIEALEHRVEALERELDAAIAAAARARTEKRQAEAAQRAAELRAKDLTRELENTTSMNSSSISAFFFSISLLIYVGSCYSHV
ncbi:hypothetical protein MUK42_25843 [Musa troglodytarum]|uniref:Uncharacterized protein n=1 Tax=Musa troglodytarum TaxID=320322 RepID=A0A9E7E7N9_9LILI|nr:hypothetical protein MUK42_25843 [Musa troglodytarum]